MRIRTPRRLFPSLEKGTILNDSFNRPPIEHHDSRVLGKVKDSMKQQSRAFYDDEMTCAAVQALKDSE